MPTFTRKLDLQKILKQNNFFLFGPRSTGKSFLIKHTLSSKNMIIIDLLDDDLFEELMRRPKALSEKITSQTKLIIIDEIQKIPKLLDEVHRLIETTKVKFLLTGSSARKLKRGGTNLLAGRAWEAQLFSLCYQEIDKFNLLNFLNFGGLPRVILSKNPLEELKAYTRTYLSEEIKAEALVRNYEHFVRFLETMALNNGQELNYSTLSSDAGVPARTLEGYIEVLKDTLLAYEVSAYQKTVKRKATTKSKIFLFDIGVANYLSGRLRIPLTTGHRFRW